MPPAFSLTFDNHSFSSDTNLLTPPLSSHGSDRPPFKPLHSDHVSLSMKRSAKNSKHHRRRLNRACVSSGELNDTYRSSSTTSSKSWPDITRYFELLSPSTTAHIKRQWPLFSAQDSSASHTPSTVSTTKRTRLPHRRRRWTVPSKAGPTRFLCDNKPSATLARTGEATATETPAMIVLRRASIRKSNGESARDSQSEITFFPRPQVTKTSTSLFGFLRIRQLDGDQSQSHKNSVDISATLLRRPSISPSPPRKPSIVGNVPLPCVSEVAQPAFTALVMDSVGIMHPLQHRRPALDIPETTVARRSSTTITTGNNVHEVIWDENVTSSSGSNTASQSSRRSTGKSVGSHGDRRHSTAVETLELQLKRDTKARRESDASTHSTSLRSRSASGAAQERRHKSVAAASHSSYVPDQRKFSTGSALGTSSHVRRRSAAASRGR